MKQTSAESRADAETAHRTDAEVRTKPVTHDLIVRRDFVDAGPAPGPPEPSGPSFTLFLHALRRNWLLGAVLGGLIAAPLAAIPWFVLIPEYKATALVRISQRHVTLLFETADQSGRVDFRSFKNTQRQLILAPILLSNALKKEGVSELPEIRGETDAVNWLRKKLEIKFPDDAEIMHITLTLPNGKAAARIVDAVVATYNEEVVMAEHEERTKRASNLERVQAEADIKSRKKRAELQSAVERLGAGDSNTLNLAQQTAMQQYSLIQTQLTKIQFDLMRAEGEVKFRQPARQSEPGKIDGDRSMPVGVQPRPDGDRTAPQSETSSGDRVFDFKLSKMIAEDPLGFQSTRDVERLTKLIEQSEKRLAPGTPAPYVEKYRAQLGEAKQKLAERTQLMRELLQAMDDGNGRTGSTAHDLPREIELLKDQERRLTEELKRQELEAKKFGRSSIEVEMLQSDVAALDGVASRVSDELERTKIELNSASRITLLGPAQVPTEGESLKQLILTVAAGIFGLLGPVLLLAAFDLRRRYVNGRKSVSDLMLMPVLGTVPLVPQQLMAQQADQTDGQASMWRRRLAESVANVTSLLLHQRELNDHQVFLVTSAMPGEGKSTLSAQLAKSMASSGHRTLLMDFDLRRPVLHRRLRLSQGSGATEIMRNGAQLEQSVQQSSDTPNLWILPAGAAPGTILQDSESGSLKTLFDEARANYDIIIVDSCPLLPVMDGRVVGQFTDGAILSVIKDVSQLPLLTQAYHVLGTHDIPVLGCVVTGDSADSYGDYDY